MNIRTLLAVPLVATLFVACGGGGDNDADPPPQGTDFVFHADGWPTSERFVVRFADAKAVEAARAELRLPRSERRLFPNGTVRRGDAEHNAGWSWHLDDLHYSDAAIELCDGRPAVVEANLDFWLGNIRRFCPWAARVVAEL